VRTGGVGGEGAPTKEGGSGVYFWIGRQGGQVPQTTVERESGKGHTLVHYAGLNLLRRGGKGIRGCEFPRPRPGAETESENLFLQREEIKRGGSSRGEGEGPHDRLPAPERIKPGTNTRTRAPTTTMSRHQNGRVGGHAARCASSSTSSSESSFFFSSSPPPHVSPHPARPQNMHTGASAGRDGERGASVSVCLRTCECVCGSVSPPGDL